MTHLLPKDSLFCLQWAAEGWKSVLGTGRELGGGSARHKVTEDAPGSVQKRFDIK